MWNSGAAGQAFQFHSPIRLANAKPYWALGADALNNYNKSGNWANQRDANEPNQNFHRLRAPAYERRQARRRE